MHLPTQIEFEGRKASNHELFIPLKRMHFLFPPNTLHEATRDHTPKHHGTVSVKHACPTSKKLQDTMRHNPMNPKKQTYHIPQRLSYKAM